MKSMNLFGGNDKSSEALFGDSKLKENTNLKESTALPLTLIQDENGNLIFSLEGKMCSMIQKCSTTV